MRIDRKRICDAADQDVIDDVRQHARNEGLTLLFAARDTQYNNAVVFAEYLENKR